MKKVFVILVAVLAITTRMSAQNSDTQQVKVSASNVTTELAEKVARIISYQDLDSVKNLQEFRIGGPNCPGCNGTLSRTYPLILVDGLEVSSNILAQLKPDDIQSFSVLKDAKALEMYGTRGTNGVIIIDSKLKRKVLKKMIKNDNKQQQNSECQHTTGGLAQWQP